MSSAADLWSVRKVHWIYEEMLKLVAAVSENSSCLDKHGLR